MKQLTCSQMGGPADCSVMLSGNTVDETMMSAWKHIEQAHPDMAKGIQSNPKEVNDKWMADFKKKWDALPEA